MHKVAYSLALCNVSHPTFARELLCIFAKGAKIKAESIHKLIADLPSDLPIRQPIPLTHIKVNIILEGSELWLIWIYEKRGLFRVKFSCCLFKK